MSAKTKKNEKLQYPLKIDKTKEEILYNVLDLCDSKSDLIKDALFYYIHKIEMGEVINRHYPYNKLNIKLDIKPSKSEDLNNIDEFSNKPVLEPIQSEEEVYDYEEYYEDEYEEDDYSDENEDIDI